jgi:hypothetical protein
MAWRVLQRLDYFDIPFICSLSRSMRHMRRDCIGWVDEEVSKDARLHKEFRGSSPEDDSYGTGALHYSSEVSS